MEDDKEMSAGWAEIGEDDKQSDGGLLITTDAEDEEEEKPLKRRRTGSGFYIRRQNLPLSLPSAHDWQQDRLEADSLLRSLYEAHREDEICRRSLLTRWPEWIEEDGLEKSESDAGRFIPEVLLRDDDYDSIRGLVRGSFGLFQQESDERESLEVPDKLSDEGVLEAVPILLPKLKRKALRSVLNLLSGRESGFNDNPWLVKQADHEWRKFERHSRDDLRSTSTLQRLVSVFRDPKSFAKKGQSAGPFSLEASDPESAARSALTKLELLPLQCLQVMLEVLHDKGPSVINMLNSSKLPIGGGSKERVIIGIKRKAKYFLELEPLGKPLPERLRKALIVMSVSARYALGSDSNLVDFLGPLPSEMKDLHDRLLSALSDLKTLHYDGLKVVHDQLIGGSKRHPSTLRQPIKKIFLNCLLRSANVRSIPVEVKKAIVTVAALARQQAGGQERERGREGKECKKGDVKEGQRGDTRSQKANSADDLGAEREVEATLRISSHLQQIMRNWMERLSDECSSNVRDQGHDLDSKAMDGMLPHPGIRKTTTGIVPDTAGGLEAKSLKIKTESSMDVEAEAEAEADGDEGNASARLEGDDLIENAQYRNRQSGSAINRTASFRDSKKSTPLQLDDGEEQRLEELEDTQRIVRIADGAAGIGYALVGCAMERTARAYGISMTRPTRSYLRSKQLMNKGIVSDAQVPSGQEESINSGRHQLSMILDTAEQMPGISSRVLENVKRRLGTG